MPGGAGFFPSTVYMYISSPFPTELVGTKCNSFWTSIQYYELVSQSHLRRTTSAIKLWSHVYSILRGWNSYHSLWLVLPCTQILQTYDSLAFVSSSNLHSKTLRDKGHNPARRTLEAACSTTYTRGLCWGKKRCMQEYHSIMRDGARVFSRFGWRSGGIWWTEGWWNSFESTPKLIIENSDHSLPN